MTTADLRPAIDRLAALGAVAPSGTRIVAVGWATVDTERVLTTGMADLGIAASPSARFRPAPDDVTLGAFARRADLGDGVLLLLEPRTEGRLAAGLARHGEGPLALYVTGPGSSAGAEGPPGSDPLGGRSRLLRPATRGGPFVLYHQPMSNEPTIRAAVDADAEAIATLFTDEGYPAGPSDIRERLSRFDSTFSTVRVADLGGDVVGFVAVHVMPRFEHGDRIARILALVVDAGVRERGIGHLLMAAAEAIARETGCAFIEITAGRHRPEAQHLYEAVGYETGIANYLRKRL
jgi:GNAT superfamily N-acetyltransferase